MVYCDRESVRVFRAFKWLENHRQAFALLGVCTIGQCISYDV